jgi:hypothetical protein
MAVAKSVTVKFTKERETKNKVRFAEDGDESKHVVGTLYVDKSAMSKLGNAENLSVTIKSA